MLILARNVIEKHQGPDQAACRAGSEEVGLTERRSWRLVACLHITLLYYDDSLCYGITLSNDTVHDDQLCYCILA
jgi:hypothetical protein